MTIPDEAIASHTTTTALLASRRGNHDLLRDPNRAVRPVLNYTMAPPRLVAHREIAPCYALLANWHRTSTKGILAGPSYVDGDLQFKEHGLDGQGDLSEGSIGEQTFYRLRATV